MNRKTQAGSLCHFSIARQTDRDDWGGFSRPESPTLPVISTPVHLHSRTSSPIPKLVFAGLAKNNYLALHPSNRETLFTLDRTATNPDSAMHHNAECIEIDEKTFYIGHVLHSTMHTFGELFYRTSPGNRGQFEICKWHNRPAADAFEPTDVTPSWFDRYRVERLFQRQSKNDSSRPKTFTRMRFPAIGNNRRPRSTALDTQRQQDCGCRTGV